MPPPSTPCPTCGKLFFPHSLGMHTAQCGAKMARQLEGCPACGAAVPRAEMSAHLNSCKAAREMLGMMAPSPKKTPKKATTSRSASRGSSPRGSRPPATDRKAKADSERAEVEAAEPKKQTLPSRSRTAASPACYAAAPLRPIGSSRTSPCASALWRPPPSPTTSHHLPAPPTISHRLPRSGSCAWARRRQRRARRRASASRRWLDLHLTFTLSPAAAAAAGLPHTEQTAR